MNYDELVKSLHKCKPETNCTSCPMRYEEEVEQSLFRVGCCAIEAADVIELLNKLYHSAEADHVTMRNAYIAEHDARIEEIKRHCPHYIRNVHDRGDDSLCRKFGCEVKELPRWIPVTERLPEEYTDVLCYYEYFRYGDYNCMFRTIDRGYFGNGRWGGEAGQGCKNKVLAWMPLPTPPKENSDD